MINIIDKKVKPTADTTTKRIVTYKRDNYTAILRSKPAAPTTAELIKEYNQQH